MRVTDLIEQLLKMPQEAEVKLAVLKRNGTGCLLAHEQITHLKTTNKGDVIVMYELFKSNQPNPIQP